MIDNLLSVIITFSVHSAICNTFAARIGRIEIINGNLSILFLRLTCPCLLIALTSKATYLAHTCTQYSISSVAIVTLTGEAAIGVGTIGIEITWWRVQFTFVYVYIGGNLRSFLNSIDLMQ